MLSGLKLFWRWFRSDSSHAAAPLPPAECCPACRASDPQTLSANLTHLVRAHLDAEERWLLKMLISNYHLNDLCAVLGVGPDTIRYRVAALRAKIMVLLRQQHADACIQRSFHRLISGSWF